MANSPASMAIWIRSAPGERFAGRSGAPGEPLGFHARHRSSLLTVCWSIGALARFRQSGCGRRISGSLVHGEVLQHVQTKTPAVSSHPAAPCGKVGLSPWASGGPGGSVSSDIQDWATWRQMNLRQPRRWSEGNLHSAFDTLGTCAQDRPGDRTMTRGCRFHRVLGLFWFLGMAFGADSVSGYRYLFDDVWSEPEPMPWLDETWAPGETLVLRADRRRGVERGV